MRQVIGDAQRVLALARLAIRFRQATFFDYTLEHRQNTGTGKTQKPLRWPSIAACNDR
jgi:hypothetical protein